jgi:hypothetical protein
MVETTALQQVLWTCIRTQQLSIAWDTGEAVSVTHDGEGTQEDTVEGLGSDMLFQKTIMRRELAGTRKHAVIIENTSLCSNYQESIPTSFNLF